MVVVVQVVVMVSVVVVVVSVVSVVVVMVLYDLLCVVQPLGVACWWAQDSKAACCAS